MRNIWFYADPHLNHEKIIRFCQRPFTDVDNMNEVLITRYNNRVKPSDTVYILGDFSWKEHAKFAHRLNGKKTLIMGNHDKMREEDRSAFSRVIGKCPSEYGILEINDNKQKIVMCHFPMESWNASFHGSWHLHGHCHGRLPEDVGKLRLDVGVDVWDYAPVSLDEIRAKMEGKTERWKQYHEHNERVRL